MPHRSGERPTSNAKRRLCYLARSWSGTCPQCGQGRLFDRFARMNPSCADCGLVFRREQGAMTGSMYVSAAVTEIFAAILIAVIFLATDWGMALSLSVCLPVFLVFSYWFLPRSMGLWTAVEYMVDESNREPWVDPRF